MCGLELVRTATIVNARVGVDGGAYEIEFYGKNITNEHTPIRIGRFNASALGTNTILNQTIALDSRTPRQWGVKVSADF